MSESAQTHNTDSLNVVVHNENLQYLTLSPPIHNFHLNNIPENLLPSSNVLTLPTEQFPSSITFNETNKEVSVIDQKKYFLFPLQCSKITFSSRSERDSTKIIKSFPQENIYLCTV